MKRILIGLLTLASVSSFAEIIKKPTTEINGDSYRLHCGSSGEAICKLLGKEKYLGHSCRNQIHKATWRVITAFVRDIGDGHFNGENEIGPDYDTRIVQAAPYSKWAPESLILKTENDVSLFTGKRLNTSVVSSIECE
jgi:hypothetical protein